MTLVATVAHLGRYPVKSMRGEDLAEAPVTWNGLLGDRRYAFVRADARSSFPWMTGRQAAEYLLFEPRFERTPSEDDPEPAIQVRTPEGATHSIDDPALRALLEERFGQPLFLLNSKLGTFDSAHLSLFGLPTLDQLSREVGLPLERQRFRANVYLATASGEPFAEDQWLGRVLAIGESVRVAVTKRNVRCAMTTIDPASAALTPAVLRTIAQRHETCAGVHATVVATGVVRVGDPVSIVRNE
jgi:uncharacterized protein YcbX